VSEENKALVRRFYEAGTGDLSVMDEIVTADFIDHHWLPGMEPCPESACVWFRDVLGSVFSDMEIKIDFMIAEGDMVDCHFALHAKHTGEFAGIEPKGNAVVVPAISTFRVEGGKLAEAWELFDSGPLLEQMRA
jgi:predicted SnoaL-like aldol condensation-catalyzing enzyme